MIKKKTLKFHEELIAQNQQKVFQEKFKSELSRLSKSQNIQAKIEAKREIVRAKRKLMLNMKKGVDEDSKVDYGHISGAELSAARAKVQNQRLQQKISSLMRKHEYDEIDELTSQFQENENSALTRFTSLPSLNVSRAQSSITLRNKSKADSRKNDQKDFKKMPITSQKIYTNFELEKLGENSNLKFFNSTNKYGITSSQQEIIRNKFESQQQALPRIVNKSSLGNANIVVTHRLVARYKKPAAKIIDTEVSNNKLEQSADINNRSNNRLKTQIGDLVEDESFVYDYDAEPLREETTVSIPTKRQMPKNRYTPLYPELNGNNNKLYHEEDYEDVEQAKVKEVVPDVKVVAKEQEIDKKVDDTIGKKEEVVNKSQDDKEKEKEKQKADDKQQEDKKKEIAIDDKIEKIQVKQTDDKANKLEDGQEVFKNDVIDDGEF